MFHRSGASSTGNSGTVGSTTSVNNTMSSRRAFTGRDVTNVGGRITTNNNGKLNPAAAVQKPVTTRRSSGVMTRSMSHGSTINEDARPKPTTLTNNDVPPPCPAPLAQRTGRLLADPTSYQVTGNIDDIDGRDSEDPLCATAYVGDMYEHFREKEIVTSVRPGFMSQQVHINERMRAILVDWLVEVHLKFKLVPETLYLTINLIDRYLELAEVSRPKLQLVGVTCLLIASKYEEIYPPELRDLVYICDRAYTKNDIIEMEEQILKSLKYKITIPSAHAFLVRYLKAGHADKKIVMLSCYLMDGTLQSYSLLKYLPSQLAAAAVFISRRVVGRNGWSPTLLHYSDYAEEEIIPIARALLLAKQNVDPELRAVEKKYSSSRYLAVTSINLDIEL